MFQLVIFKNSKISTHSFSVIIIVYSLLLKDDISIYKYLMFFLLSFLYYILNLK